MYLNHLQKGRNISKGYYWKTQTAHIDPSGAETKIWWDKYLDPDSILGQLESLRSEIPPAAPWLPILVIHIRSEVKRQSQSYTFLKIAKNSKFEILQATLHVTHLLKLLDKMYSYEIDPIRTVGTTEQTRHAGRTDR